MGVPLFSETSIWSIICWDRIPGYLLDYTSHKGFWTLHTSGVLLVILLRHHLGEMNFDRVKKDIRIPEKGNMDTKIPQRPKKIPRHL